MYTSRKEHIMAYATTKKQNRILLIALVVLLAAAAILIAVTGSANKSKPTTPPLDNAETGNTAETASPSEDALSKLFPPKETELSTPVETVKPSETEKKDDKPTSAETDDSAEVSVTVKDPLPRFSLPVNGKVFKEFAMEVPVFSCTMNDYRTHAGVDILCASGSSVVAPADGIVGQVWEDPMMGICLNLIHTGGAVTTFKGLAPETMGFIAPGTEVKKGQVVGASGTTALIECGDEPHVHMELAIEGELVNPADYMEFEYLSDTYED